MDEEERTLIKKHLRQIILDKFTSEETGDKMEDLFLKWLGLNST